MKPSTLSRFDVRGAAGRIEVKLNDPGPDRRGIALIAHPHPLFGGTNENKVVRSAASSRAGLPHGRTRPAIRSRWWCWSRPQSAASRWGR